MGGGLFTAWFGETCDGATASNSHVHPPPPSSSHRETTRIIRDDEDELTQSLQMLVFVTTRSVCEVCVSCGGGATVSS